MSAIHDCAAGELPRAASRYCKAAHERLPGHPSSCLATRRCRSIDVNWIAKVASAQLWYVLMRNIPPPERQ